MPKLLETNFPNVPDCKQIKTEEFLEACSKIPSIFDLLGGKVFYPVKNDVVGNIKKIQDRFLQNPIKFATLNQIIEEEKLETDKALKAKDGGGIATNALMWLKRGLLFIILFMEHLLKKDYGEDMESLKECAKLAYKDSLQSYHGWIVQKLVQAATSACPYRSDFLKKFSEGEGLSVDEVLVRLEEYIVNFRANVDVIYDLFETTGAEKTHKV
ncbi:glycolipid transfer protein [Ciona intestinalis]